MFLNPHNFSFAPLYSLHLLISLPLLFLFFLLTCVFLSPFSSSFPTLLFSYSTLLIARERKGETERNMQETGGQSSSGQFVYTVIYVRLRGPATSTQPLISVYFQLFTGLTFFQPRQREGLNNYTVFFHLRASDKLRQSSASVTQLQRFWLKPRTVQYWCPHYTLHHDSVLAYT